MSGKAIRRRAKLVKAANQGNLAKAQRGKASANLPLPSAPTKEDYVEKVPASLRRLMALKAAAERPKAKRQKTDSLQPSVTKQKHPKLQQQHQGKNQQQAQQSNNSAVQQQPHQLKQDDQLDDQQKHPQLQPRPGGKAAAAATVQADDTAIAAKVHAGVMWEQPKKLKQRKKEYLKKKMLKKKGKRIGDTAQDKELALDRPAFGEVVHQPPKVQLKRKHWDAVAALKAQHQQQQKYKHKQKHNQQQAKSAKKHHQDPALLELRQQVIEGYRAARGPREGLATLDSLKQLVQ